MAGERGEHTQPSSVFATVDLPTGVRLTLTIVCEQEPNWDDGLEYNAAAYTLLAHTRPIQIDDIRRFPGSKSKEKWREILSAGKFPD